MIIGIWAGFFYNYNNAPLAYGDFAAVFVVGGILISSLTSAALFNEFYYQRTEQGKEEYYKWAAFQNYLEHFSSLDEKNIPHIAIWDKYLVYATVMGVAKKVIGNLKKIYPEAADTSNRGWCSVSAGANIFSSNTFGSSISGSLPASGSGGRMSGGGGGGSGGGGGGGR